MKKVRILSLDGGGIRGIIPATIMQYVEEKLQEFSKNENARIADYFDFVIGTSTGGILSCFYLVPNSKKGKNLPSTEFKAKKALEFYIDKGFDIFNKSKYFGWFGFRQLFDATQYSPKILESILLENFKDIKHKDLLSHCMITTYDLKSKSSFFFDSKEKEEKMRDFYVRDVTRSTSAAPTYFPSAKIKNLATGEEMINVDGGVFANNPTMCAYAECRDTDFGHVNKPTAKDMLILSIGTGAGQIKLPDVEKSGKWNVIKWAKSAPNIMMDGAIDTVDFQLKELFEAIDKEHQKNYKRIDVPLNKRNGYSSDMAEASPENIEKLKIAGNLALESALEGNEKEYGLDEFIRKLIES